jgi:hypothetical protein
MRDLFFAEQAIKKNLCYQEHVRIFVKPPESAASNSNVAQEAFDALRNAGIVSARIGGFIDNQGVVLVDGADVAFAMTMLERAGFKAIADSA